MLTLFGFWFISLVTYDHVFIQKNGQYFLENQRGILIFFLKLEEKKLPNFFNFSRKGPNQNKFDDLGPRL